MNAPVEWLCAHGKVFPRECQDPSCAAEDRRQFARLGATSYRLTIISGGQTGADRGALDAALDLGVPCGGWCPKGRRAEDGAIPERYPLKETHSSSYIPRTIANIKDSDATLVLHLGTMGPGTKRTIELARSRARPHLVVDIRRSPPAYVREWIYLSRFERLNVAGPRESVEPGIQVAVTAYVRSVLRAFIQEKGNSARQ